MATRTAVMEAVEKLNYRVTIGDVAAQSGLDLNTAQREILALASDTGGNLQVAESGEIAYKFAPNFRQVLVSRSFWLIMVSIQTLYFFDNPYKVSFGATVCLIISPVF